MKSTPQSDRTALADFEIIYNRYFTQHKHSAERTAKAQENIREMFGLENLELMIVAYFVHIHPHGLVCKKVPEILTISDFGFVMNVILALVRKGFLERRNTLGADCVFLSEAAVESFSCCKMQSVNFVDMLRNSSSEQMADKGWIKLFKTAISTSLLSPFARGWFTLKANELTDKEALNFCYALRQFILHFTEPLKCGGEIDITKIIRGEFNGSALDKEVLDALVQKGLLSAVEEGYVITPKVAEVFLYGHDEIVNYNEISRRTEVIKYHDISKKELFFSAEKQKSLDRLLSNLSSDGFRIAKEKMVQRQRNPAILSLFYGGPGTGKTESVKQIALQTKRDLFRFDISDVIDSYVGETEKNYRKLLNAYRYIVAVKTHTPILFFNEADQVLSKRLESMNNSVDKMENSVSNMLLQEFEDMHGILFATTNNVDLIDRAFYRRFLYKIELQGISADARKLLWKDKIPELSEDEAEILANTFTMSGSEIDNVVLKRELDDSTSEKEKGLEYIEALCREELSVENISVSKCGF